MPYRPLRSRELIDAGASEVPAKLGIAPRLRTLAGRTAGRSLLLALALATGLLAPGAALAAQNQIAIIQDFSPLVSDPAPSMPVFRALGASTVRVIVNWHNLAPSPFAARRPRRLNLSSPNSYPASGWGPYDAAVEAAQQNNLSVELTLSGGAPTWAENLHATGRGFDRRYAWKPNPAYYGDFVRAVAKRYSGTFTPPNATAPLPAVHFWALWNEPNFGEDLAPQATKGSTLLVAPILYRGLVRAGFAALRASGHGSDTILIGELAAGGLRGAVTRAHPQGLPGYYAQTKPLVFIRALYCLDVNYHRLTGAAARALGCPSGGGFRAQNPGLFSASGVADHAYTTADSPLGHRHIDPDFATFAQLGGLERGFDRALRAWGSHRRYPIYNDEFGYITRPPQRAPYLSQQVAAYYLNWTEYLSWRNPRVASYMQYLLKDPAVVKGNAGFASGLETPTGQPKLTFYAYRLPLYLPRTALRPNRLAEVWGDVRPAHFMALDSGQAQAAEIQYQSGGQGAYTTVSALTVTNPQGYFDVSMAFPGPGNVRLAYTYPSTDPFLPVTLEGQTIYSRVVQVTAGH